MLDYFSDGFLFAGLKEMCFFNLRRSSSSVESEIVDVDLRTENYSKKIKPPKEIKNLIFRSVQNPRSHLGVSIIS